MVATSQPYKTVLTGTILMQTATGPESRPKFVPAIFPAFFLEKGPLCPEGELPRKLVDQPPNLVSDSEVRWPRAWKGISRIRDQSVSVGLLPIKRNMTVGTAANYVVHERKQVLATPEDYLALIKQHGPSVRDWAVESKSWIVEVNAHVDYDTVREAFGYCCLMTQDGQMPKGTWISEKHLLPVGTQVLVRIA